ncbi:helix-turn-helix transcriptional regulator [Methylobacterium nodulans]|uniref:Uncharacterized protein n=1 Tax=Methylobacterium nodulans (strain LMG 21967 / CNCM I-2342 / ORS 2060) TaxID=460265 RepID=B8IY56_METNO|nr:hypothetical protein [Methylobacterium nodulans]ACL63346.1 conserved hypothetical protein [Methylobacterium nodulans ORS 2060]
MSDTNLEFLSKRRIAEMAGVSMRTIEREFAKGGPPATHPSKRRVVYARHEVERWLAARTEAANV